MRLNVGIGKPGAQRGDGVLCRRWCRRPRPAGNGARETRTGRGLHNAVDLDVGATPTHMRMRVRLIERQHWREAHLLALEDAFPLGTRTLLEAFGEEPLEARPLRLIPLHTRFLRINAKAL